MRPIDADKLKEKAFSMEVAEPDDAYTYRVVYESDIDEAETLETRPAAAIIAQDLVFAKSIDIHCTCTCERCGAWINENMLYCHQCGALLTLSRRPDKEQ